MIRHASENVTYLRLLSLLMVGNSEDFNGKEYSPLGMQFSSFDVAPINFRDVVGFKCNNCH